MRLAITLLAFVLAPFPAIAQAPGQRTGNELLEPCKASLTTSPEDFLQGYCAGVVASLRTMSVAIRNGDGKQRFCIPSDATNGQLVRVVIKHLEDDPSKLHRTFTFLAGDALEKAFPCPR